MSGILLCVGNDKSDIVRTIKTKNWLQSQGMFAWGLVKYKDDNVIVPSLIFEDLIGLKVIAHLD